jgi:transcriptional regulator with XRE-family HTH domain
VTVEDFERRFREALRKRLYPHAPLHLKQIAKAIGRSENTLARWWRGETRVLADDLYRLAAFMAERGDRKFLHEIFGDLLSEGAVRDELAASVLSVVRSALAGSSARGKLGRDTHTWFDAEAKMAAAPSGHADYVRGALGLRGSGGDLVSYAARVLGWLAVTERADGVLVVRHDGRRISPLAAERICEWLEDRAEQIAQVRRSVLMDGQWIDAYHRGMYRGARGK